MCLTCFLKQCVKDPFGNFTMQSVDYEWVPFYCAKCKRLGHEEASCSSQYVRSIWVPKPMAQTEGSNQQEAAAEKDPTDQRHTELDTPVHDVVTNAQSPRLKRTIKKTISFLGRLRAGQSAQPGNLALSNKFNTLRDHKQNAEDTPGPIMRKFDKARSMGRALRRPPSI